MTRILFVMAAVMAVLCCKISSGQAQSYGNAPWCAVVNQGDGEVVWDCEYQTVQQCAPNVVAGNRGFCNVNPTYVPPQGPPMHRRRHTYQQ
jgi:Protein of unknown function (DUF3551)